MPRIRTVKPDLFRHHDLYKLEQETGLPLRLAFIGLFTECDREGRFVWCPEELKIAVLPHDNVAFSRVLHALSTREYALPYVSEGKLYGFVPGFKRHQVINGKEKQSELPEPTEEAIEQAKQFLALDTRPARVIDPSPRVTELDGGKGKERKGKEGNNTGADAPNDKYRFEGKLIKLNTADFEKIAKANPRLDLESELLAYDATLVRLRDEEGQDVSNWWHRLPNHLRNRNAEIRQKSDAAEHHGESDDDIYRGVE